MAEVGAYATCGVVPTLTVIVPSCLAIPSAVAETKECTEVS